MFQSLPNLYEQVNSGLYYGNLDLISMSMKKKPCLIQTKCTLMYIIS